MKIIKANKTQMMKLIREKKYLFPVEIKMKSGKAVTFAKAHYRPDYWAEWAAEGRTYKFFLTAVLGVPKLVLEVFSDGERITRDVLTLSLDELAERGMIHEVIGQV